MSAPVLIQVANTSGVFASDVTEGDLLLVITNISSLYYPVSGLCTDTQKNTYQLLSFYIGWPTAAPFYGSSTFAIWYAIAKSTGANTVSVSDKDEIIMAAEYSASSIDVVSSVSPTSSNPAQSSDITTSFNDELLVGVATAISGVITGVNSPYNEDYLNANAALESVSVSSTDTYQSDFATTGTHPVITALIGLCTEPFAVISGNCGVAGATVYLTGALQAQVTADGSGNYSFANVINGSYTVTPYANGNAFNPNSQDVTVSGSTSETGVNFSNAGLFQNSFNIRGGTTVAQGIILISPTLHTS